jgi:hypothetical protein
MALGLPELERILSYAQPAVAAALLVRLGAEGLLSRYKFFAFFLVCLLSELVVVIAVRRNTDVYFWAYLGTESILWFAQVLIIVELFSLVLASYGGIARTGRRFIWFAFGVALAVSVWFAIVAPESTPGIFPALARYMVVSRVIAFTLLFFLALLLAFVFWYPVPLARNVLIYAAGYCVYFAARALTRLAENLLGTQQIQLFSTLSMVIAFGCLASWLALLTRRGEMQDMTVGHRWSPAEGELLVRQLESINATLLKVGRK